MDLATLTYESAKALEGTAFEIQLADGIIISMKLEEVLPYETHRRGRLRGYMSRRDPFSMYFVGPLQPVLPQAIYKFSHQTHTIQKLFIVPIGQNGNATEYEAVFT